MQTALDLHNAIAAVCPIASVSIGKQDDKSTWRIDFAKDATPAQRAAAQAIIDGYDIAAAGAAEATEQSRKAALTADSSQSDLLQRLKTATPAQIDTWLVNNVTNLAQARTVLGAIIKYLARNT